MTQKRQNVCRNSKSFYIGKHAEHDIKTLLKKKQVSAKDLQQLWRVPQFNPTKQMVSVNIGFSSCFHMNQYVFSITGLVLLRETSFQQVTPGFIRS